jgi:hypothetical protein
MEADRRIEIRPLRPLALGRTHTVQLGAGLRSADGVPLGTPFTWQFRTVTVSVPREPFPADGTTDESPFVALMWTTSPLGGPVRFQIHAGPDSAAVARREGVALDDVGDPRHFPVRRWPLGAVTYWAVTAYRPNSSERVAGPVWQFRTVAANTPTTTIELTLSDWSALDAVEDTTACFPQSFLIGGTRYKAALRWDLRPFGPLKLAAAAVTLGFVGQPIQLPSLYSTTDWRACDLHDRPYALQFLGTTSRVSPTSVRLSNDRLVGHLEAMTRYPGFHGFMPTCPSIIELSSSGTALSMTVYQTGPSASPAAPRIPAASPPGPRSVTP